MSNYQGVTIFVHCYWEHINDGEKQLRIYVLLLLVLIHTNLHTCIHTYIHTYIHTLTYSPIHTHTHAHTHISPYTHTPHHIHTHTHVLTHAPHDTHTAQGHQRPAGILPLPEDEVHLRWCSVPSSGVPHWAQLPGVPQVERLH